MLELRRCVKVEVAVLGSPVPNKPTVSVDVKQHSTDEHPWGTGIQQPPQLNTLTFSSHMPHHGLQWPRSPA